MGNGSKDIDMVMELGKENQGRIAIVDSGREERPMGMEFIIGPIIIVIGTLVWGYGDLSMHWLISFK